MTSEQRFERDLPGLLAQLAPMATPDYRDDVVGQTARMRQRPVWRFPERWLPVDLTIARAPSRGRPRSLALLVIIALLIAALAVAYIGTRPAPLPAPFGPAANGSFIYASGGDVYAVDSATGTPRAISSGPEEDSSPLPSRDGRHIVFERLVSDGSQRVFVAGADGSDVHPLVGTYTGFAEQDWSPDGRQVAIIADRDGSPAISVLEADGSGARTLDLEVRPQNFWYLPGGGFIFKGTSLVGGAVNYAIYTVDADGSHLKQITAYSSDEGTWFAPYVSGDGRQLVYHQWDLAAGKPGRIRLLDIATGIEHDVPVTVSAGLGENHEIPQLSPDDKRIIFYRFMPEYLSLSVVPVEGGTPIDIGPRLTENATPNTRFSPDGSSVLAYYPSEQTLWLLDLDGVKPDQKLDLPATDVPEWQRAVEGPAQAP